MRLIDADALKFFHAINEGSVIYVPLRDIVSAPTIDAEPVRHGHWCDNGIKGSILNGCSICGYTCGAYSFNYCPNCGAKMDGEIRE